VTQPPTERSDAASKADDQIEVARERYQAWLDARDAGARVVDFRAPQSTGYSSVTYLADVERDGATTREVIRSVPTGATVFKHYDLDLQVACLRNLDGVVSTPTVIAHERDAAPLGQPFYVMEFVDGRIPDDNPPYALVGWLKDESPEVQRAHYESGLDLLVALHRHTPDDVGLADHLAPAHDGANGLDREIERWRDLLAWGREGTDQPTIDGAWEWLDANRPAAPPSDVVLWGDARISNVVFAPDGTPRAVLDWEMAGSGPGEVDLAWFLWMDRQFTDVFGAPRLDGFPGEAALIERWQDGVGREATDLQWYLVFAGVRFSTTLMRVAIRSQADGLIDPAADVYRNHLGTRLLAQVLDLEPPGEIGLMG